ncbi:restriction endonuclease subunit S [Acinetobacter dispersus]|uniref:restriction endonuclease subunit S n=1 Tax=Acinetobacter dispersus TaxID=70348 RepID=UPI00132EFA24|nr:restriction endonuclease subunit S [Acinetobacter dispersus]QHH98869.1 restriction endonuclease subunit S [Acinetobacter dispersus]
MSFLEKLLNGAKVEWKTLRDVSKKITSGGTPQTGVAEYWEGGTIPWMSSGEVNLETIYETENFITESGLQNSSAKFVPKNSLVIALAGQGKTRGKVARTRIDLTTNQSLASIIVKDDIVNHDYLYHFLKTQYENLRQISSGSGTRGGLNLQMISNYKFPLPCPENPTKSLEIQAEIVRILDAFSAKTADLIADLTIEVSMWKNQHKYYCEQLLGFEDEMIEWKVLGEVANFTNGKGHEKDIAEDGEYIVVNSKFISTNGRVAKYSNKQICPLFINDILLVMSDLPNGKALAKTFIVDADDRYTLNQRIAGISVKNKSELLPEFLYYFLNRNPQLLKCDNGVDQTNLRKDQILSVQVPMLSIPKQKHIVSILDKFNSFTGAICDNLSCEIELRQKQYEYYRDLLLSFPKPENVEA